MVWLRSILSIVFTGINNNRSSDNNNGAIQHPKQEVAAPAELISQENEYVQDVKRGI